MTGFLHPTRLDVTDDGPDRALAAQQPQWSGGHGRAHGRDSAEGACPLLKHQTAGCARPRAERLARTAPTTRPPRAADDGDVPE
jgi:hypothetical protein